MTVGINLRFAGLIGYDRMICNARSSMKSADSSKLATIDSGDEGYILER
jgi:hypothetical protein